MLRAALIRRTVVSLQNLSRLTSTNTTTATDTPPSRKDRIEELKQLSRNLFIDFRDLYIKKNGMSPSEPNDAAWNLLPLLDQPIPEAIRERQAEIEAFVTTVWLEKYPRGARLRLLQRNIAHSVPNQKKSKETEPLPYDHLIPIIGSLERQKRISVRVGKSGRLLIDKPFRIDDSSEETILAAKDENSASDNDKKSDLD